MLHTFQHSQWHGSFSLDEQHQATQLLEEGHVLLFPNLSFELHPGEHPFLTPNCIHPRSKNISYSSKDKQLKGSSFPQGLTSEPLKNLMHRFQSHSQKLLNALIPHYQNELESGRVSYRPVEISGRKTSVRQDDTRIHIDAFSATPLHGKRILRVFSNINPHGQARVWNLGETFEEIVDQFKNKLTHPFPGIRSLFHFVGITKSYRSLYDHLMLQLHDFMKKSDHYQNSSKKTEVSLPANSTWVVMTDKASHAALRGQYILEQTFYLPWEKMQDPELSPFRILTRLLNASNSSNNLRFNV